MTCCAGTSASHGRSGPDDGQAPVRVNCGDAADGWLDLCRRAEATVDRPSWTSEIAFFGEQAEQVHATTERYGSTYFVTRRASVDVVGQLIQRIRGW